MPKQKAVVSTESKHPAPGQWNCCSAFSFTLFVLIAAIAQTADEVLSSTSSSVLLSVPTSSKPAAAETLKSELMVSMSGMYIFAFKNMLIVIQVDVMQMQILILVLLVSYW